MADSSYVGLASAFVKFLYSNIPKNLAVVGIIAAVRAAEVRAHRNYKVVFHFRLRRCKCL